MILVPAHVAPLFVQIPHWNGRLNVYHGRPTDPPRNPFGEDVLWHAIYRAAAARVPTPPLVPGRRWTHEVEAA